MSSMTLRPSFAPVWRHCAAAVPMSSEYPSRDTIDTVEGTAAHWVSSDALALWRDGAYVSAYQYVGQSAPNGVIITRDIADSAQVYIDDVQQVVGLRTPDLHIEEKIYIPTIHSMCEGTPDAWWFDRVNFVLYVWDFKHGRLARYARDNMQLVCYIEGIRDKLGINGYADQQIRLDARIVQPRCYQKQGPIDAWTGMLSDIRGAVNILKAAAVRATSGDAQCTPGPHCKECPAFVPCRAARTYTDSLINSVQIAPDLDTMTLDEMATERLLLEQCESLVSERLKQVDALIEAGLLSGKCVQGLTLETGKGRLGWTCHPDIAEMTAQIFGFSVLKDPEPVTPTQAISKAPADAKAKFKDAIKPLTNRSRTGLKIIKSDEGRVAAAFKPPRKN